jgi:hypothetical protein
MTDQTKQRMVNMLRIADPKIDLEKLSEVLSKPNPAFEFTLSEIARILAWSDRQSAAAEAAALRVALRWEGHRLLIGAFDVGYVCTYVEGVAAYLYRENEQGSCEELIGHSFKTEEKAKSTLFDAALATLITPAGTSALASMLEAAERKGYERGYHQAVKERTSTGAA